MSTTTSGVTQLQTTLPLATFSLKTASGLAQRVSTLSARSAHGSKPSSKSKAQLLESRINGEVIQHADTTDMVFNVRDIVSHVSKNMTLLPGDIILTGSPAGITPIKTGDIIECEIEGIGTLLNPVQ
jgi:2-keto-4-pentenoate hydratase/2-oxohepta-3-ene-1,7-dioic acid hydratase in catechol pathway